MRKLVMRDKTIVLIIFYSFTFLANAAYATDEEELLDAFFVSFRQGCLNSLFFLCRVSDQW